MTDNSHVPTHGAIDLSALAAKAERTRATSAGVGDGSAGPGDIATDTAPPAPVTARDASASEAVPAGPAVSAIELTEANFPEIAERSAQVPVLVVLWAEVSEPSVELKTALERFQGAYGGRFIVAAADVQKQPAIAQAFQVQAVPAALALIAGRPAPLFQGTATDEQLTDIIDQVLQLAAENGVNGSTDLGEVVGSTATLDEPEPPSPLHQEAYDAIEREDFDAAVVAYDKALRENPKDTDAKAGRAQVRLMQRTRGADLQAVRKAAADAPADVEAQMAVADMDVVGGKIEDAFGRLIALVATLSADAREPVRERLVELFEIVGGEDPRVVEARRALSTALF